MAWAYAQETGTAGAKAVLAYLASRADWGTFACYPSVSTIAEATELDRSTVRRHLRGLEDAGLIDTERQYRHGRQTTNLYVLNCQGADGAPPVGHETPPLHSIPTGGSASPTGEGRNFKRAERSVDRSDERLVDPPRLQPIFHKGRLVGYEPEASA